jgi:hypothetical protein
MRRRTALIVLEVSTTSAFIKSSLIRAKNHPGKSALSVG